MFARKSSQKKKDNESRQRIRRWQEQDAEAGQRDVERALCYAYRDRKVRKREFRSLWISRINAACRLNGLTYNRFIEGLRKSGLDLDRKILAELAVSDPGVFTGIVRKAELAL